MKKELKAFADYMREVKHASENTRISYQRDLEQLEDFLVGIGISKISQLEGTHLKAYADSLGERGLKAATVCRHIASIRAFCRFLYEENLVATDLAAELMTPKVERTIPDFLEFSEAMRLLEQPAGNTPRRLRDKAMLELLYATGIHVSELLGLMRADVNLRAGYIVCGKGEKERKISFGREAAKALSKYLYHGRAALASSDAVKELFLNHNGKPMSRQGFWKLVKRYAEKAQIEKIITPHTLRHSFAIHMLEKGADLRSVQEMMGHVDIITTQIYPGRDENIMRRVYASSH